MIPFFGILRPSVGPETVATEAPFKKSFFGAPVDPAVVQTAVEEDALYLSGKQPEPRERSTGSQKA